MTRAKKIVPGGSPTFSDQGIRDDSGANIPESQPITPSFNPLLFLTTAKGPDTPVHISNIGEFNRIFGEETYNKNSKYWDHAAFMSYLLTTNANKHMIQRIIPDDADYAYMRISIEVIDDSAIPNYERNPDNSVIYLGTDPVVDSTTPAIAGKRINILFSAIDDPDSVINGYGAMSQTTGTVDLGDGIGTIYPIMDIRSTFKSELSNNIGISIFSENKKTSDSFDDSELVAGGGYPYTLALYERDSISSNVIRTPTHSTGATTINFSLDSTEITQLGIEQGFKPIYTAAYTDKTSNNLQLSGEYIYGPMDEIHMYDEDINALLDVLYAQEEPLNPMGVTENKFSINLLGETDFEGNLYHSIRLINTLDAVEDTVIPSSNTIKYMTGGSDGDISYQNRMDNLETFLLELGNNLVLLDKERNPWTAIIDSGYPMYIKEELIKTHIYSEDHIVYLSDQDITMKPNTPEQTLAAAEALTAKISLYNESPIYSTNAARFVIMPYMGTPIGSLGFQTKEPTVVLFDLINKLSKYMGSGTGGWNDIFDPVLEANKFIDTIRIDNFVTLPKTFRDNLSKAQLLSVETFGANSMIYTNYQTAYPDDTSVLNTITSIQACIEALRIGRKTHKILAGNDVLSEGQIIKESNKRISEYFQDKSPAKITVTPETVFNESDSEYGNRWTTRVTIAANVSKLHNTFTVITTRL